MENIRQYFSTKLENSGIGKADITRGTFIFGGIAGVYILSLWALCFLVSPTKYLVHRLPFASFKNAFSKGNLKAEESRFLKKIPEAHRGRLSISFGEMLILKTMLGPAALPLKLWLTIKLTILTQI